MKNIKMYVSYEQPFEGKAFTSSQMRDVYRDMTDKTKKPRPSRKPTLPTAQQPTKEARAPTQKQTE